MIDVRRNPIDFRGERNGGTSHVDEVTVVELKIAGTRTLAMSMWQTPHYDAQRFGEIELSETGERQTDYHVFSGRGYKTR
ncbi:MAG: hypothetical protein V7609_2857 [Verrucomicrobiota bacterium]